MALVSCKECSTDVSDNAYKCPSCGTQLRKLRRGPVGQIFKWLFILWNILMLIWLISGLVSVSRIDTTNAYEVAGAAIGASIGATFIVVIWIFGDIILGLFALLTRPKAV